MSSVSGKWSVRQLSNDKLAVAKLNGAGYSFLVGEDEFNRKWLPLEKISEEEFNSIQWPRFLQSGEIITITVTESGDYYIED